MKSFHTDVLPLKDKLFRLAMRITFDREEAEDITQETLIKVWQNKDSWDEIDNMEAYCLTICRRLSIDSVRRKGVQAEREQDIVHLQSTLVSNHTPEEILDQKQRVALVHQIIDQLPETQRTVIQLRDIEGLSYDEISQITALSPSQVKVYLHRARTKIRELL